MTFLLAILLPAHSRRRHLPVRGVGDPRHPAHQRLGDRLPGPARQPARGGRPPPGRRGRLEPGDPHRARHRRARRSCSRSPSPSPSPRARKTSSRPVDARLTPPRRPFWCPAPGWSPSASCAQGERSDEPDRDPAMTQNDRFHALDAARGFALLLGIVLHATMSFFLPIPARGQLAERGARRSRSTSSTPSG